MDIFEQMQADMDQFFASADAFIKARKEREENYFFEKDENNDE